MTIGSGSNDQAQQVAQISTAIEAARAGEQSAAAAEQLNRNAEGLQQIVAQFKVNA